MVILVPKPYKIISKDSARVINKTIDECRLIYNCWCVLSPSNQRIFNDELNREIKHKLEKCYKFYNRKYGVTIERGYGEVNDIEINISNICEAIKSWEE